MTAVSVRAAPDTIARSPLPPGWAWATLGDLCEIVGGITVDAKRIGDDLIEVPYLRVANVQRGSLDLSVMKTISVARHDAKRLELQSNDILFNEGGDKDKVGRGWIWSGELPMCIHQNHIFRARLRIEGMDGRWVSAYANELGRLYFFQQTKQTTNLASISLSKLRELPIPVAPLAEQKRVWSIVESLFGEIEAGEQELLKAREGVATYRRAVLKAAVTGELTKEWRASRGDLFETGDTFLAQALKTWRPTPVNTKHPVPTRPDQKQLPRAWVWATMDQVLTDIEAGLNVKCEGRPPGPEERGLIKISAVTYGEFRELESKTLPGEAKVQEPLRIQPGDFLFSRANTIELVGAPTIVSSITRELYLSDKVLRFRFAIPIEKWAFYWLRSPWGRREIETRATGAQLSMRNITQESIRALPIPLPSEEEMQVIVGFLDLAFQEIGQLGAEIDTWCSDVSRSRQATLSAAFSGKLVPQAPNDEPASELLARLRAARAAAPAPKAPRAPRKNARSRQQVAAA